MKLITGVLITIFSLLYFTDSFSQKSLFNGYEHLFIRPKDYVAAYTSVPPEIDGNINDEIWAKAIWTDLFVDIEGDKKPSPPHGYETRVKMMWDSTYLYIAAELKEPHIWATLTKRDEIVFFDNDFEIFVNPDNSGHNYFEIEINALNTIFDLFMVKPYREGGNALFAWDAQGMKHAVQIDGSLNNSADIDKAWTVEFAIPFRAFTLGNKIHIPKNGEMWRINFSRVQWDTHIEDGKYIKDTDNEGRTKPENNWVWSQQGVIDMHLPERWGYLQFSDKEVGKALPSFKLTYQEKMKSYLWLIYYKEKAYWKQHGAYATSLGQLEMPESVTIDGIQNKLTLEGLPFVFRATITNPNNEQIQINNEGLIQK